MITRSYAKTNVDSVHMSISVSLPEALYDWIREYSKECDVSMSALIKALIIAHKQDVTNQEEL